MKHILLAAIILITITASHCMAQEPLGNQQEYGSFSGNAKTWLSAVGIGGIAGWMVQRFAGNRAASIKKVVSDLGLPDETMDIKRIIDEISQTQALIQDVKSKGTPTHVLIGVTFKDGTGRIVEYGTKPVPAPPHSDA